MKAQDFIDYLLEELGEFNSGAGENTKLRSLDFWDSMSALVLISAVDRKFGIKLSTNQINSFETFKDIILVVGSDNFTD